MKRDLELVRTLLLIIEERSSGPLSWINDIQVDGHTDEQIQQHLWWLMDAGLIAAVDATSSDGVEIAPRCLTHAGCEFLDSIRAKDVWQKTLDAVKSCRAESLDAVKQVAVAVLKAKLQRLAGIEA